jgi:hypothetical protein
MYHGPAQTESARQSASHHARDGSESVRSQPKMKAGGQSQVPEARTRMSEPEASENVRASGAGRGGGDGGGENLRSVAQTARWR